MIMAAACHPDAQARVQEELDEVIGKIRSTSTLDFVRPTLGVLT